ncbi:tetratricopeptide repeat protein [Streptomyces sp. NPDC002521]
MSENAYARVLIVEAYRQLPPDSAQGYRIWALGRWPTLTREVAAAMLDVSKEEATRLLTVLASWRLMTQMESGAHRYLPGVREHALEAVACEHSESECAAAMRTRVEHHLRFAVCADRAALPHSWHLGPLYDRCTCGRYLSREEGLAALEAELDNLVQSVFVAEELGEWELMWQLVDAFRAVQIMTDRHAELYPALQAASQAALRWFPHTRAAGRVHMLCADTLVALGRFQEAECELEFALRDEQEAGHRGGLAMAVESWGLMRWAQGREQRSQQDASVLFLEAYLSLKTAGCILRTITEGTEWHEHRPRAEALLHRHLGRVLSELGCREAALKESHTALDYFTETKERYNAARTLTDLGKTHLKANDKNAALPYFREALSAFEDPPTDYRATELRVLIRLCLSPPDAPTPGA